MKISVFYDHITQAMEETGRSLPKLLAECRSYGIRGLEINYTQLKNGGAGLYRTIQDAGLAVSCLPVRKLIEQLARQGYDGYLAIEHFNVPDQMKHIRRSAEFLGSVCSSIA